MIFLRVLPKKISGPTTRGPQELGGPGSLNRLNPGSYANAQDLRRGVGYSITSYRTKLLGRSCHLCASELEQECATDLDDIFEIGRYWTDSGGGLV